MPPRARGSMLGGLPDIQSGSGIDPMDLFKMAQVMESINASEAARGTPDRTIPGSAGTPDIVSTRKPFMARLRGYEEVPGMAPLLGATPNMAPSIPINGSEGDPSTGLLEEAQGRNFQTQMVGGSPSTWVKRGTPEVPDQVIPGTPGTDELRNKAGIAHLLTPGSAETLMNERGYKNMKVQRTADNVELAFNPQNGTLRDTEGDGYYFLKKADAVKEAADFWRTKASANAQGQAGLLRLYSELQNVKSYERSTGQKATLRALDIVLPEVLGIDAAKKIQASTMQREENDYKSSKQNALRAIDQLRSNPNFSTSEKKQKAKAIMDRLKSAYSESEYYDLLPKDEKSLIQGF